MTGADKPGTIRLGNVGNIYASPVAGGGRVYVTDLEGNTIVVSHNDRPEVLAFNSLDDEFAASAAIVGRVSTHFPYDKRFDRGDSSLNWSLNAWKLRSA